MKKEFRRTYVNKNKMGIMYNRENCCKPVEGKHMIDLETWARKEHYAHFASLDDPFFGICAKADFTGCYRQAKNDYASFFLYSLHRILKAANRIEEFRYRIEDGNIVLYDRINASPTIGREDGSFGFGYFGYSEDREEFVEGALKTDVIYYSSIPWIDFTGLKHASGISRGQSVPRISTGKLVPEGDRLMMSVSVELNHGLADGYHVAEFFRLLGSDSL